LPSKNYTLHIELKAAKTMPKLSIGNNQQGASEH